MLLSPIFLIFAKTYNKTNVMEDKKENKGLKTLSDNELEQLTGGVTGRNMKCEERTTRESCLSVQKCGWQEGKNKCVTNPLYA